MAGNSLTLKGRIVRHDTKSATKDGVDILKVSVQLESPIGGETVHTMATLAIRGGEDSANRFPLDENVEITIKTGTK